MAGVVRGPRLLLLMAIAVYLGVSSWRLDVFPPVGEDEPWIAAAPYKLATEGTYGSDLFAGYYGVERRNYQQMPLFPLLEAAVFKIAGVGVVQMRTLSILFGFVLLVVVFLAGSMIADERVGAVAAILMVTERITGGVNQIGILLLDRARINRYDIAVPVFGLLAWLVFERAERRRSIGGYVAAGALVGCASLSHLYGAFWMLALGIVMAARRGRRGLFSSEAAAMAAGAAVTWLPWVLFIASAWADYLGQMRFISPRLQLFDWRFYVTNVATSAGPLALGWAWLVLRDLPFGRIGTWLMVLGVPAALVYVGVARRRVSGGAVSLALILIVQLVLFLVLIQVKTISYMIALWPLAALVIAFLGTRLWDGGGSWTRLVGAAVALGVVIEGASRLAVTARAAETMTPYDFYARQVQSCIPPGSLVLGLQHYWLGLRAFPYRTWLMPINMAHPVYDDRPLPFEEAIERVDPDVILIDRYMADLFQSTKDPSDRFHHLSTGFERYQARHSLELLCTIRDRTYGPMDVYKVH